MKDIPLETIKLAVATPYMYLDTKKLLSGYQGQ